MSKPDKTDGCGDDTKPTVGPLKLTPVELALLKNTPLHQWCPCIPPKPVPSGLVLHVCPGSPGQVVADELLDVRRH